MAMGKEYRCGGCGYSIEAWDDGDPYFINEKGRKQYAYHPSANWEKCIGVDSPHLCLECGQKFKVDSRKPISKCRKCKSENISDVWKLEGKMCPYCEEGIFEFDPESVLVS